MNKILFGGSFDPIHLGHINMALNAAKQLNAQVVFLPSKVAIWKKESTDAAHKIKMIELSIEGHPELSYDLFEVNSEQEQVYSIDTVRHFVKMYPDDKFFYLIGTDHVNAFHNWKEAEELSKLATIIFFNRPGLIIGAAIGAAVEFFYLWLVSVGATLSLKEGKTGLFLLTYFARIIVFVGLFALLVILWYQLKIETFKFACWAMLIAFAPATLITIATQLMHKEGKNG